MQRLLAQASLGLALLAAPAHATTLHDAFAAAWTQSPARAAIEAARQQLLAPELAMLRLPPGLNLPVMTPLPSAARLAQLAGLDAASAGARLDLAGDLRASAAAAALAEADRRAAAQRLAADRALLLAAGAPALAAALRRDEAGLRDAAVAAAAAAARLRDLTGLDGVPDIASEPAVASDPSPDPLVAGDPADPGAARQARAATLARMRARLELETAQAEAPALRTASRLAAARAARAERGWHDGALSVTALLQARAAAADAGLAETRAAIGVAAARGRLNQALGALP